MGIPAVVPLCVFCFHGEIRRCEGRSGFGFVFAIGIGVFCNGEGRSNGMS